MVTCAFKIAYCYTDVDEFYCIIFRAPGNSQNVQFLKEFVWRLNKNLWLNFLIKEFVWGIKQKVVAT